MNAALKKRLDANVRRGRGCWLWQRSVTKNGYGQLSVGGRADRVVLYAHRLAYELSRGPIPGGLKVLHRCDEPRCCNPQHLFLGTQSDNVRDCVSKGRHRNQNTARTHCRNGHELAGSNVKTESTGSRRCQACRRQYTQHYREVSR